MRETHLLVCGGGGGGGGVCERVTGGRHGIVTFAGLVSNGSNSMCQPHTLPSISKLRVNDLALFRNSSKLCTIVTPIVDGYFCACMYVCGSVEKVRLDCGAQVELSAAGDARILLRCVPTKLVTSCVVPSYRRCFVGDISSRCPGVSFFTTVQPARLSEQLNSISFFLLACGGPAPGLLSCELLCLAAAKCRRCLC